MARGGDVRQTTGVPPASAFSNANGTPLVLDISSGTGYYMDAAGAVQPLAGGGGGAPTGAEYLVGALNGGLTNERLVTNTATVTWDFTTPGQAKANAVVSGATWTETEVDFGSTPRYDKSFTVTDAAISAGSKVAVVASGKAATGRSAGDDLWDAITYSALPAAGSMTVYAYANPGPVVGKRKIQYQVA